MFSNNRIVIADTTQSKVHGSAIPKTQSQTQASHLMVNFSQNCPILSVKSQFNSLFGPDCMKSVYYNQMEKAGKISHVIWVYKQSNDIQTVELAS